MAATNNMHNLVTLIRRLEAATLRLEDIASSTIEIPQGVPALDQTVSTPPGTSSSKSIAETATSAATPTPSAKTVTAAAAATPTPPPAPAAAPEPLPDSIEDFDAFLESSVGKYATISSQIGGVVAQQAAKVVEGFKEERAFLLTTTKAKKPNMSNPAEVEIFQKMLQPINQILMSVMEMKETNRGSPFKDQLSAVADGIMILAWVTDDKRPAKHVEESKSSAQYYGNRVLKEFREKDPQQVEWIKSFLAIFTDLIEYIKQYFPSGIPWNPHGIPAVEALKSTAAPASAAPPAPKAGGGAPPPPPPPGPPPVLQINEQKEAGAAAASGSSGGLASVFSDLNKGENVTKGLRKVDKSEMTHKNPSLRTSSTVTEQDDRAKSPAPSKRPKPESMRTKKPPVKVLEGNKWLIENYENETSPITIDASLSHSILITKCTNTTIIIKGKANAVTIDNTKRLNLIVDSLVSSVDIVKSQNFALQVLGQIPSVLMDQIDGAQVYFSKESTRTRIIHSKSAGINLNVIAGGEEGEEDYKEVPLPAQMESYYDPERGELVDVIVSHAG